MRTIIRSRKINVQPQQPTFGIQSETPQTKYEGYFSKLAKYIPAEVNATFLAVDGVIKSLTDVQVWYWVTFAVLLGLTPVYLFLVSLREKKFSADVKPDIPQLIIGPIAFVFWVFALGGPFATLQGYQQAIAAVVLFVATLAIPAIDELATWWVNKKKQ